MHASCGHASLFSSPATAQQKRITVTAQQQRQLQACKGEERLAFALQRQSPGSASKGTSHRSSKLQHADYQHADYFLFFFFRQRSCSRLLARLLLNHPLLLQLTV
jgi:hypothetical protein